MPRRRERSTFVDQSQDNRKAFCDRCLKYDGIWRKLVPRIEKGIVDDKFQVCSFCGQLVPFFDLEFYTEYEPKGYVSDNPFASGTKVEQVQTMRRLRKNHKNSIADNDIEIPNFAGKPDTFLENIVNEGGIIKAIADSGNEE